MGNALFDQLLNAGLVDKKKVAQVKKEKHKKNKIARNQKEPVTDENKLLIQQQLEEKKERDRLLNLEKEEKLKAKAIRAQIKQLIEMNAVTDIHGDIDFNFVDNKQVKRLKVSSKIQQALVAGFLAVAKWEQSYKLVPKLVAEKIIQRDPSFILLLNDPDTESANDIEDEYADFQIPDDLMW